MTEKQPKIDGQVVAYVRRSTFQQEVEHQEDDIDNWLERNGVDTADVEKLEDTGSGSHGGRENFKRLIGMVDSGMVDHVVVWELSRIAREGELAERFFNRCEENDVTVHITNGNLSRIEPDGTNRFVASILAAVYAEERRTLVRRIKSGQKRAVKNDKWLGRPPLGFTTDEQGRLVPNIETFEGYDENRDSFYAIEGAVEAIVEDGESKRSVAARLECSRTALARCCENHSHRFLGEKRTDEDEQVQSALDIIAREEGEAA